MRFDPMAEMLAGFGCSVQGCSNPNNDLEPAPVETGDAGIRTWYKRRTLCPNGDDHGLVQGCIDHHDEIEEERL